MKLLGWILLLTLTQAHAQQVIDSAPLSITEEGTRKIIERADGDKDAKPAEVPHGVEVVAPPAAEALNIPNDDIVNPPAEKKTAKAKKKSKAKAKLISKEGAKTPESAEAIAPVSDTPVVDGQLKLDPAPVVNAPVVNDGQIKFENKLEDKKEVTNTTPPETVAVVMYDSMPKRYLQYSIGYLNSKYDKIHSALDNGSMLTSFRFVGDLNSKAQIGFAVEIISDKSGQDIPESIRSLQYRLFGDYHAPLFQMGSVNTHWIGGMALAVGDYSVKRRYLNTQGQELSVKVKEGTLIGLIPGAGLRFYLVGRSSFDLVAEYHLYFGKTQSYIGGLALNPRLSFEF